MKILKNVEIGELIFAQMHNFHQAFFDKNNGGHTRILLRDTPHYQILCDNSMAKDSNKYTEYLECSWQFYKPENNTPEERRKNNAEYLRLFNDIKKNGVKTPIKICETPDGRHLLVDGNHRAAIAYFLCLDIPYREISLTKYLMTEIASSNNTEQYTAKNGVPSQSIFYGNECILKGRRYDILERFNKIALQDIREKNVLDLGCNIASSSHLAWFYGANSVLGCEYSSNISKTALRISTALGSRIDIVVQDLGEPLNLNKKFDTIFAFSIYFHIKNKEMFAENILNNLAANGVVYFEGHERTSEKDYESLFKHFQSIELIGHNADGIHSKKYSRPFWELRR